jgi:D-serine deaminase-like pyridoxal phosphate-dependent protein
MQTTTPLSLLTLPSKDALVKEFVGKDINSLRTPALIVDKSVFKKNCERVTKETERRGMGFRAHVKSESTIRWAHVKNRVLGDDGQTRRTRA